MKHHRDAKRVEVSLDAEGLPIVSQETDKSGADPWRWIVTIREIDQDRLVEVSANEALELLEWLLEHEAQLRELVERAVPDDDDT